MPEPQNNFLIFNENNNPDTTMGDADYASLPYRLNGVTVGRAPLVAHNKMYRQWSIMTKAVADMIEDKGYDALDSDLTDLTDNLKSSVKDLARDELSTEITTIDDINTWKESITATPTEINTLDGITADVNELNILDGVTASTAELNYSTGLTGNIQQQINAITGVMSSPFPTWNASTPYAVGDICIASNFKSYQYLECVVAGTTGATMPSYADVGQLVTDNEVKWLVCDFRDSAPVGAFRSDMIQRAGWLKVNGATVNRADYPRLWAYAVDNLLTTNDTTNYPGLFGEGDGVDTFTLPNFEDYFVRYSYVRAVGSKQASQMAQHTHSCGNQDTSHTHTINNKSISHNHSYTRTDWTVSQQTIIGGTAGNYITPKHVSVNTDNNSIEHNHTAGNQSASHRHNIGNTGSGSNTYPDNITMQMYIKY